MRFALSTSRLTFALVTNVFSVGVVSAHHPMNSLLTLLPLPALPSTAIPPAMLTRLVSSIFNLHNVTLGPPSYHMANVACPPGRRHMLIEGGMGSCLAGGNGSGHSR